MSDPRPPWTPRAWGPDDPTSIHAGVFEPGIDNYTAQPEAVAVRYGVHSWRFPILFFGAAILWILALGSAGAVVGFWLVVAGTFPVLWGWGLRPLRARRQAHRVLKNAAGRDPEAAASLANFRWVRPGDIWRAAVVAAELIILALLFSRYLW